MTLCFGVPSSSVRAQEAMHMDNPFCAAVVGSVHSWDPSTNKPISAAGTATYRISLIADRPVSESVKLLLLSDSKADEATIHDLRFANIDGIGAAFSGAFFVTLPVRDAVRFVYVDEAAIGASAPVSCATMVSPTNDGSVSDDPSSALSPDGRTVQAIYREPVPAAPCSKPYEEPRFVEPSHFNAIFMGTTYSLHVHSAWALVWIDSNGRVSGYTLYRSSGNAETDHDALVFARGLSYVPAHFYCVAVPDGLLISYP